MATAPQPSKWNNDELDADAQHSIGLFRDERTAEPLEQYLAFYDVCSSLVENLIESTVNLTNLRDVAFDVLTEDWEEIHAMRYLASPWISMDDLAVLVDSTVSPTQLKKKPTLARAIVDMIMLGLDRQRFPWLIEEREPTSAERESAVVATAALMATQRTQTMRRTHSKDSQEAVVRQILLDAGFKEASTRDIANYSQAPGLGEFCAESSVAGRKADIVVRLWDGRVMPIECKVSNSSTNSVKRLNNDAAVKAKTWILKFGTDNIVPAAVLAGVFKAHNLKSAQDDGLTLFWAHSLKALTDYIESTR
jgi:hypothetical protein